MVKILVDQKASMLEMKNGDGRTPLFLGKIPLKINHSNQSLNDKIQQIFHSNFQLFLAVEVNGKFLKTFESRKYVQKNVF